MLGACVLCGREDGVGIVGDGGLGDRMLEFYLSPTNQKKTGYDQPGYMGGGRGLTVSAIPTTSRFAIASGRAFFWIGVGEIYCLL